MPFPTAVFHMSISVLEWFCRVGVCSLGIVGIFAQGSGTVFVTAGPGVFSWWLCVYATLAGDPDVVLGIWHHQVGRGKRRLVGLV